jgi:hypothetical protein
VDTNKTAEGRKKNRHVEIQLLSNTADSGAPAAQGSTSPTGGAPSGR